MATLLLAAAVQKGEQGGQEGRGMHAPGSICAVLAVAVEQADTLAGRSWPGLLQTAPPALPPPRRWPADTPSPHPGAQEGQGGLGAAWVVPRWSRWPAVI